MYSSVGCVPGYITTEAGLAGTLPLRNGMRQFISSIGIRVERVSINVERQTPDVKSRNMRWAGSTVIIYST
jgi:hypothetical protein